MAEKKPKLAENKIKPTTNSVEDFLNTIEPAQKRLDSFALLEIMRKVSNEDAVLWSNSYIGFGFKTHKSTATGRESEWMRIGFSPRKANFSLYFGNVVNAHAVSLEKLGKYKAGLGCIYINKLSDIDLNVLNKLTGAGWNAE